MAKSAKRGKEARSLPASRPVQTSGATSGRCFSIEPRMLRRSDHEMRRMSRKAANQ
jgi:hypothetical protein